MAGANGGWPAPPTLQVASNLLRSISPTASTIRWMMSSSSSHSIMSTGSRKRCRRSGVRKKWAIDPHLGSMAPRESCPPPQRHYLLMPRGHQFAVRYGNRLFGQRLVLAVQFALELLHPSPVLPGLGGAHRPWLAQAGDGVVLPGLELGRKEPLLATPSAASRLVHRRGGDHRLQPRRRRPALAAGQRAGLGQGLGPPTLQGPNADPRLAGDNVNGRTLRRPPPPHKGIPEFFSLTNPPPLSAPPRSAVL